MDDQLRAASEASELLRTVVAAAAAHLASLSNDGGKISVAKLDQHQVLAYDVAHAAAAA